MEHIPVEIEDILIEEYLDCRNWLELTSYLKRSFKITRNSSGKPNLVPVSDNVIEALNAVIANLVEVDELSPEELDAIAEVFRALRNCTVSNHEVQTMIANHSIMLHNTKKFLDKILNMKNVACAKVILQFLVNMVVKNSNTALQVWDMFEKTIIELFVQRDYSYLSSALLYNIVYIKRDLARRCELVIYNHVLEEIENGSENEYCMYLLEIFVQLISFMYLYEKFKTSHRLALLTALQHFIATDNERFVLAYDVVKLLSTQFKIKSDFILKTANDVEGNIAEPREVVLLLEILGSLSADDRYRQQLQDDKDLVIKCTFVLKALHMAGKQPDSEFTPVQKLSTLNSDIDKLSENPVFGFKADLVRFLGNACWKNCENQDQLRELDCISLLLDCCNIDARNPFIMQWTILAIRNLCEGNAANQAVIAGMTRRGVVDSSTLKDMGLTLHDDGTNTITLLPVPSNSSSKDE